VWPRRVDETRAKSAEAAFARRVAEVSERFTGQAPAPGGKEAILRGIADLQRGTPNYERMTTDLAAKIRRQAGDLHAMFAALGAVEQIFFAASVPAAMTSTASGSPRVRGDSLVARCRCRAVDTIFRADGNDESGEVGGLQP